MLTESLLGEGSGIYRTTLPNGIRVISETIPGIQSETVGVWVGSGSRDETDDNAGSTHFLEHMLFKGTATRSAKDIARTFDRTGGEANAMTAKECTAYYSRCLVTDLPDVCATLWDMVLSSTLDVGEFERERTVILDELAMGADDPEDVLFESYDELIYSGSPLGRPVGATKERIQALVHDELLHHYREAYVGPRLIFSAAGGADHEDLVDLVWRATQHLPEAKDHAATTSGRVTPVFSPGERHIARPTEQQGLIMGVAGLHDGHDDRFTLTVLASLLGGGMSSRLFQTVREERGLAYAVHTTGSQYSDVGDFGIYAGCAPAVAQQVVDLCVEQCQRLASEGPMAAEVADTAAQVSAATVLGMESTAVRMNRLAKSELSNRPLVDATELVERVRGVTAEDVQALAQRLFGGPWALCSLGPADNVRLNPKL